MDYKSFAIDRKEITNEELLFDLKQCQDQINELLVTCKANGALVVLSFNDENGKHHTAGTVLGNTRLVQNALRTFIDDFNESVRKASNEFDESLDKKHNLND